MNVGVTNFIPGKQSLEIFDVPFSKCDHPSINNVAFDDVNILNVEFEPMISGSPVK